MDAQRASKVKPTEWQKAETNKAETLLSKAQKKLDEELDDVKHMNQMARAPQRLRHAHAHGA